MKTSWFPIPVVFLLAAAGVYAQGSVSQAPEVSNTATSARATVEIAQLMGQYHQAVASHNSARMASMFVDQGSTWFNVLSDAAYARARAKDPAASKIRHSSFQEFAKFLASSHAALDPRHSNVRILTDGTVASVYFNFVFLIDGKPENQGSETWQLVKGTNGWKIAAITYSSNPPVLAH